MYLRIEIILLSLISVFIFGQNKAVSTYRFKDYEEAKKEFLSYVQKKPDEVVEIEGNYYSIKKMDSFLLIKNKFKKERLKKRGYQRK